MVNYSYAHVANLKSKIFNHISREIDLAVENNTLDKVLKKYGVDIYEDNSIIPVNKRMKILVIGGLAGKVKDYQKAAKSKGIDERNIDFIEFSDARSLSVERLRYSYEYSDIIIGPTPHMTMGVGRASSLISCIEKNPDEFPRLLKASANRQLKITITNFGQLLLKTRYYDAMAYMA